MPARLKSLELQGYKTFANRTLFEYSGLITAIIGPNGSGKSNIADSIRWVLGEQSYSLLRGKKTEDMIFAGSELRPRASMASATMVFDNEDGWLPIDFSEVAITRRAYRDGENEYLINGQRVRLRDVSEMLSQSGLAERTYTVIGQGLVDAALALKAEERRKLFEEAAGIGLHRSRREEALHRLETTHRNLDRVEDILAELNPRLRSLEKQARRAQEYEQVRVDLQAILRDWYGYHWHESQYELNDARVQAQRLEKSLNKAALEQQEIDEQIGIARGKVGELRTLLNNGHKQLSQLHSERELLIRERAVSDERLKAILTQEKDFEVEFARLTDDYSLHQGRSEAAQVEVNQRKNDLIEAQEQEEKAHISLLTTREKRNALQKIIEKTQGEILGCSSKIGINQARRNDLRVQLERLKNTQEELLSSIASAQKAGIQALSSLKELEIQKENLEKVRTEIQQNLQIHREKLNSYETIYAKRLSQRARVMNLISGDQARLDVLDSAEQTLVGYSEGAQFLVKIARKSQIMGVLGALGSFIEVPAQFEIAIAAALGEYIDAVVVQSQNIVDFALDSLHREVIRGMLLPLDQIASIKPIIIHFEGDDVFGIASDLVKASPEIKAGLDLVLGKVIIVSDRKTARRVLKECDPDARAVTLQGDVFAANGPVVGGKGQKATPISRIRERRELSKKITDEKDELSEIEKEISKLEVQKIELNKEENDWVQKLELANQNLENQRDLIRHSQTSLSQTEQRVIYNSREEKRLQEEIISYSENLEQCIAGIENWEKQIAIYSKALISQKAEFDELFLDDLQTNATYWNTLKGVSEQALKDAQKRFNDLVEINRNIQISMTSTQTRIKNNSIQKSEIHEKSTQNSQNEISLGNEIEKIRFWLEPAESELTHAEHSLDGLQNRESIIHQSVTSAEHNYAQARILQARRQEALETLRHRIEDDFGLVAFDYAEGISGPTPLPLQGLVEQLPKVTYVAPELEEQIKHMRVQLRRMGPINSEAQQEYNEVKDRYHYLTEQVNDLKKAEEDIREVIAELDTLIENEFQKTFKSVASEFEAIFKRLFGGGSARLVLTSPDNLTETGIDIEARLPGRRSQGLSLLSGGERSLTATSLVFALLKVSPTPFCVLDEVDAMLDEANVGRFRDLLKELSSNTQFIVVTHNRHTVQVADVIYGITMGRDSTSQVISLKLDELDKVV